MSKEKSEYQNVEVELRYSNRGVWSFAVSDKPVTLPLKAKGESWSKGWDIPTLWAVDSAGQSWLNNAHGGALKPVSIDLLIGNIHEYLEKCEAAEALAIQKPEPEWVKEALAAGWTPPKFKF